MSRLLYFLTTFAEAGLSVFGVRGPYDHPAYTVMRTVAPAIEIRAYAARSVVESPVRDGNEGEAFGRLFRYITGANAGGHLIAMTVPVEQAHLPAPRPPSAEVQPGERVMRFYLPPSIAADAPAPADPLVRILALPATTLGVLRTAGGWDAAARSNQAAHLREALRHAGITVQGEPIALSYDPPFTMPFLRRNEVALTVLP